MQAPHSAKKPASHVSSWRDTLPIHPAAELFPRMSPDEQRALGEDIKKNGLTSPIVLWQGDRKSSPFVLDGITRLDAIEAEIGRPVLIGPPSLTAGKDFLARNKVIVLDKSVDPYAYVISANIHRRHLTAEQKRDLIAKLIKATPEKSDRQIAETVKASPTTVGTVRAEMEATGDVSKLDTRTDSKGRQHPAKKTTTKPTPSPSAVAESAPKNSKARDDSAGECERLCARNERLETENARLRRENIALRSEIKELKARLLDIPAFLDRTRDAAS